MNSGDDNSNRLEQAFGAVGDVGELGGVLRQLLRRARGSTGKRLTCRELAERTGYGRSSVSDWLSGKALPSADRLGDLLIALGASASEQRELATARDGIEERRRRRAATSGQASPDPQAQPVSLPSSQEVRYSLPPDTAGFTGRDGELARIAAAMTSAAGADGMAAVHTLSGMPGVGKTTLAVHVAHLLQHRFPGRRLFIDLHAHTPGHDPVRPEAALAGLLAATGVDPRYLPTDLAGLAGLWRDRMAGQRTLVVLDNAASSAQVIPLLPGNADCLVLVTSRRHLGDLPGTGVTVALEALPEDQAQEMFVRLAPRAAGQSAAVAELALLAGHLPLAVSLLARVFARHPTWTLADLARETRASMLTLAAERDSVAAAFEVSYRYLAPGEQLFFRLLGLHPGTTIDAYAAASLGGLSLPEATVHLDVLHREGLLSETGYRRYRMHDLIRDYARQRAPADGDEALERLLDYFQHTVARAQATYTHLTRPTTAAATYTTPSAVPGLDDPAQALDWARAERDNLLACLDHVTRTGQHGRVAALTAGMSYLLRLDGPWTETIARQTAALDAARQVGSCLDEASALRHLGLARMHTGAYQQATEAAEAARCIYRDLGDLSGMASALNDLGKVQVLTGDLARAVESAQTALRVFCDIGYELGQANALMTLGIVRRWIGEYDGAAEALEKALEIHRGLGGQQGQANALNWLGIVRRQTGDYAAATQALEAALPLYREIGDRIGEANGLAELGVVWRDTGDYERAAQALETALSLISELGDRGGQAEGLNDVGSLHRARGDLGRAVAYHRQALDLARAIDSPVDEAHALAGLGRCDSAAGRASDAHAHLSQALEIFQRVGTAEATEIAAELDALTTSGVS
ncbi:MAG TPA: tetratricopeptide repeat protein [Streptosporangiaceae bacterium]|nr:tetratricopeptide repeat protein [Streptosporangiaceae bacterium]